MGADGGECPWYLRSYSCMDICKSVIVIRIVLLDENITECFN